jgi:hypothetical protein
VKIYFYDLLCHEGLVKIYFHDLLCKCHIYLHVNYILILKKSVGFGRELINFMSSVNSSFPCFSQLR